MLLDYKKFTGSSTLKIDFAFLYLHQRKESIDRNTRQQKKIEDPWQLIPHQSLPCFNSMLLLLLFLALSPLCNALLISEKKEPKFADDYIFNTSNILHPSSLYTTHNLNPTANQDSDWSKNGRNSVKIRSKRMK